MIDIAREGLIWQEPGLLAMDSLEDDLDYEDSVSNGAQGKIDKDLRSTQILGNVAKIVVPRVWIAGK